MRTQTYSKENSMVINKKKTKLMLFNPCTSLDFIPDFNLEGTEISIVEEMKLLGVVVRTDMKWNSNTDSMVKKGYQRLWVIRRLKTMGATNEQLKDSFVKQVRSIMEFAAPAWHAAITNAERTDIERVQKTAMHIILGEEYSDYRRALQTVGLDSLESRRTTLCLRFAKKAVKHPKHSSWFQLNTNTVNNRREKDKYYPVYADHTRFKTSPISYLTKLLNSDC